MRSPAKVALALTLTLAVTATTHSARSDPAPYPWEGWLRGDAIVMLGEVHDNPIQQRLRLEVLKRAFAAGWRPAIAMEQFDREHQADIEQARREHPEDASYLIERAAPAHGKPGSGWNWDYYRPYVSLALQYRVPLLAANLSRRDAEKIVEHGYAAVLDEAAVHSLGLEHEPASLLAAQKREIDVGHCHAMPKGQLPAMARAQLARDAVMADVLRERAANGVILLAGDGHVRLDIGVPTWLGPPMAARVFSVGFVERGGEPTPGSAFDAVVVTDVAQRNDPCEALRHRKRSPRQ